MKPKLILLIALAVGIVLLITSIIIRKRKRARMIFASLGLLTGLLPLLLWLAFSLFGFIKERKFVGNYEGDSGEQGIVSLDMFNDNTFIMKSDSCTAGFVQGTWDYSILERKLLFESSSQNMGKTEVLESDSIAFVNIPICIRLISRLPMGRTGKPLTVPIEKRDF